MSEAPLVSGLYEAKVMHRRLKPARHRLDYRMVTFLLDLDELPELDRRMRLFSFDRPGLVSFRSADQADGQTPLRQWIEARLDEVGLGIEGGPVRILCLPRVMGYAFNPLSVWFCYHRDGTLKAILHEVHNTFGERHGYLIPAPAPDSKGIIRQSCDKDFFVSPFMDMEMRYHFRIRPPAGIEGETVVVAIHQTDPQGPILHASLVGERRPLSDRTLASALVRHPMVTLKVIAGIHWEALHLWRKGLKLRTRPKPPPLITVVGPAG